MNFTVLVYAFIVGLLPSLVWLFFWLREDNLHPEPRGVVAIAFIAGGISVIVAIFCERYAQLHIQNTNILYMVWAAIEELLKFGAMMVVVYKTDIFDEPIDAMIYCITVALGFAALENALFVLNPLHLGQLSQSIITENLRFIGASLVHVVCSALIGFSMGISFYRDKFIKFVSLFSGIILAVALHTAFNLAIIYGTETSRVKTFGWVWSSVIILIILFEEIKAVRSPDVSQSTN